VTARFTSLCMIIISGLSVVSLPAYGVLNRDLEYNVYLDGDRIGFHKVKITPVASGKIVETEASFAVKFLIFEAYRYLHYSKEEWSNGCLNTIQTKTNDNGEQLFVNGRLMKDIFSINSLDDKKVIKGCVRSFAYWDLNLIQSPYLLNSQNGQYTSVDVVSLGGKKITLGQKLVDAMHYRIQGDELEINLWYSPDKEWLALSTMTKSGATLRYEISGKR